MTKQNRLLEITPKCTRHTLYHRNWCVCIFLWLILIISIIPQNFRPQEKRTIILTTPPMNKVFCGDFWIGAIMHDSGIVENVQAPLIQNILSVFVFINTWCHKSFTFFSNRFWGNHVYLDRLVYSSFLINVLLVLRDIERILERF